MKYYVSCKTYGVNTGNTVLDSWNDDNNGKGYSLTQARARAEELDDYKKEEDGNNVIGWGTEAKVYDWHGKPA